jgi:hypothetical protein
MWSFARHTTFMKIGIADFECKVVKISKQGAELLFTGAEFSVKFPCKLCSICWSNHPRAFVGLVGGKMMSNFCIQQFVHFYFKNKRKVDSKRAKLNGFWLGRTARDVEPCTRHVGCVVPGPHAHAEAPERPAVRGPCRRHCASRARDACVEA